MDQALLIGLGFFLVPSSYHPLYLMHVCFMIIYCDFWK